MTTRHDDDRDADADFDTHFDFFLRREDELSALLGQIDQPAPPPGLEARILAQAREALKEPVAAANDPAPAVPAPSRRQSLLARLRVPLGLAATVVIGVSIGLRWQGWDEGGPQATLSDVPAPQAAPVAAPPAEQMDLPAAAAPAGEPPAGPAPRKPQAAPVPRPHAAPATAPARDAGVRDGAEVEEVPPPPAPPPPPPPAPASAAAAAPPPAPAPVASYAAPRFERAPAPAFIPPAPVQEAVTVSGRRTASRQAPADAVRARQWLALIGELLDLHLNEDAAESWRRFRGEYPDYPVPAALQQRIDALSAPPAGQ